MTTMIRAIGMAAVVTVLLTMTTVGSAAVGRAVPGDPPPPLSLDDIGSARTLTFPVPASEVSLSLPIPADLVPEVLRGTIEAPAFVVGGTIDVVQEDRILSRTPVDPAPNSPIELPLNGIQVVDRSADIRITARLNIDGTCVDLPDNAFHIIDTEIIYGGREAIPRTVADFLPPILRGLTIYVPDDVRQEEGSAAVSLAAAITAHYGSAHPVITTGELPRSVLDPPTTSGPLERQIVINSSAQPGLVVNAGPEGSSYLTLGGSAEQLAAQSRLLVSDLAVIAVASAAVAGPQPAAPQLAPTVRTLADIGVVDTTVTSTGWPEIAIGIDQTRLGRPVTDVRVQLTGTYTPTASGVVAVRSGDRTIATIPTDGSGRFNTLVDIPDDVLRRYTGLTLTLENADRPNGCFDGFRNSLSLSSAGEVRTTAADPPPDGFTSLPQALLPWTQLAWTVGDVADIRRGVSIAAALQRMSAMPLDITVVDMATAATSALPAILIAADGAGLPDLPLPVTSAGNTITARSIGGQPVELHVTPQLWYGALQIVRNQDRTVLVANSTADPSALDELLSRMTADNLWFSADGDAIIHVAGRDPVIVDIDQVGDSVTEEPSTGRWVIVAAVVAAAGLIIGAAALLLGLRRRNASIGGDSDNSGGDTEL